MSHRVVAVTLSLLVAAGLISMTAASQHQTAVMMAQATPKPKRPVTPPAGPETSSAEPDDSDPTGAPIPCPCH